MSVEFALMRAALRAVYGHWDRSNPYEGPELCACGHLYDAHSGSEPEAPCMVRECECEEFEAARG